MAVFIGCTTVDPLGDTSETCPVSPSVRVARSDPLVVQESVTLAPAAVCPGETSAVSISNGARTFRDRWAEASTPSSLNARNVKVVETIG